MDKFGSETSGDLDAALNETIFALAIDSDNYTAKIFKGKILSEQKKFSAAEKIYQELIDAEPDKSLAFKGLASTFQISNQFDKLLGINLRILCKFSEELGEKMVPMICLLYTSPSPRDGLLSRMPSSA